MSRVCIILVIVICTVFYSCFDKHGMYTPDDKDNSLRFLSFTDNLCQGEAGSLAKGASYHVYIKDYYKNGNELTMRIHYWANCCPGFVNEATVCRDSIVIAIADTLRAAACNCEYENDYEFIYPYNGNVRVIFKWWDVKHEFTFTYMDTTIQIGSVIENGD